MIVIGGSVVPRELVLHEVNPFALGRVGNDAARFAILEGQVTHRAAEFRMVVAVDLPDGPIESGELLRQRGEVENFVNAPEALDLVVIDDEDQVVEVVMWREENCLPI